ncbi:ABC transporter substrate-binding protein [Microlunatus ginsengisoli]|uniref:Extracellular solute-binding protein n=1 Tax=Microlunatus ginsengisoli TaxID=363863 RepID=A0ABP7AFK0_9ACTN
MKLTRTLAAIAASLTLVAGLSACGTESESSTEPTKNLELISWWTSGSEAEALNVLIDAFKAKDPGVTVENAPVVGGGGTNAQVVLTQRLLAGDPPDVWQTFPSAALKSYQSQRQLADVSSVVTQTGLNHTLPQVILDGLTVDGKQYGVPTSSHRGNMLFFNRDVLKKAGVSVPGNGYTTKDWIADLKKVKESGAVPLCVGAQDAFTTAALFENILLSVIGPEGWDQIVADRFDWKGDQVNQALDLFGQALDQVDPQADGLSWDAATKKLGDGGCAFETMNDSAFGELIKDGKVDGTTFGEVPFPGTEATYVAVVDTFVQARSATNAKNASDFLAVIADPAVQLAFSKAKGSVPVRTDVDVSSLTPYQQSASTALRNSRVLWSIVHGSAMSPAFQQGFYSAVDAYVRTRDAKAFSNTLIDAVAAAPPQR